MTEKLTPDSANEPPNPLHNVGALNAAILAGFKARLDMENHIDELTDTHVKESKDALKKIKRDLKADTDIDSKDLNNFFAVYKRQENAKTMEDEDAGRIADNMRTVFGALATGSVLDFVDVLDNVANNAKKKAA